MSIWRAMPGIHNSIRYVRNNKVVKTKDVPAGIKVLLETHDRVDDEQYTESELTYIGKRCIFCHEPYKYERLLNQQSVALCAEHYYSKSMGQIAEQLRYELENPRSLK